MPGTGDDAASRLWWALRRYAALLIIAAVGMAAVMSTFGPPPPPDTYRASALVIARQLEGIRPEHLPRMAHAIFTSGNVATRTVESTGLPIRPDRLIPAYADLEPIEGTVLVRVVGMAEDPGLAARVANAAATALVEELNRGGPQVGAFSVQEGAHVPATPEPRPLTIPPGALGALVGLILGLGVVALLVATRRPVLTGQEAEAICSVPLTGLLRLSAPGRFDDPLRVVGTTALLKRVFPERQGTVAVIGTPGATHGRSQVAVLLSRALARSGFVCFVPAGDRWGRRAVSALASDRHVAVTEDLVAGAALAGMPIVVDGPSSATLDLPPHLPHDARVVLVVLQGTSTGTLVETTRQFLPGELSGLVWVSFDGNRASGRVRDLVRRRKAHVRARGETPTSSAPRDEAEGAASAAADEVEAERSGRTQA